MRRPRTIPAAGHAKRVGRQPGGDGVFDADLQKRSKGKDHDEVESGVGRVVFAVRSHGFGFSLKNERARKSCNGGSDGKEDVSRAIGVVHENARGDEWCGQCSDAPGEVEEREQGRASLRIIAAGEERDGRHGHADTDAEEQKRGREQRSRS